MRLHFRHVKNYFVKKECKGKRMLVSSKIELEVIFQGKSYFDVLDKKNRFDSKTYYGRNWIKFKSVLDKE